MPFLILFLFGGFSAAFALILELVFFSFPVDPSAPFAAPLSTGSLSLFFSLSLILAAFIEEFSKLLFLRQFIVAFREKYPVALSFGVALSFALGFASVEVLFALSALSFSFALFGSIALHIATSAILLSFLKRQTSLRAPSILIGLGIASLLHIAYNFLILTLA